MIATRTSLTAQGTKLFAWDGAVTRNLLRHFLRNFRHSEGYGGHTKRASLGAYDV